MTVTEETSAVNGQVDLLTSKIKLRHIEHDPSWETFLKYFNRLHDKAWTMMLEPNKDLKLSDDEVLMTSYPKCGTNWMMQILHQIRTGGSEDFNSIFECYRPVMGEGWIEKSASVIDNIPEIKDKLPSIEEFKNIFKNYSPILSFAHITAQDSTKLGNGKRIVVIRKPTDAFVSLYNFLPNFANIDESKMTTEDYYFGLFTCLAKPNYFEYVRDWVVEAQKNDKVLLIMFENLKKDISGVVDRLADFIGVKLDAEHKAKVLEMSSFQHMYENREKYSPEFIAIMQRKVLGVPPDEPILPNVGFVRKGGSNYTVPQKVRDHMQLMWQQVVAPAIECKDYDELYKKMTLFK